ncbi:hypothetical protein EOD42_14610 [Rhodovarius crocodyli]|uniref:Uncharacterized protein n=1 Tax=Rhodovarius crocodyli TaxID=1979269 RepID=A0A437MFC0_9PROT|nr:hypothetical protein [Rhodovarius crocodyli]RVT96337.1 hypothetical protein EOD42_14610 [Rhodovarius crocodyli]
MTLVLPSWLTPGVAEYLAAAVLLARDKGQDAHAAARDAAIAIMPAAPWPMIEEAARWAVGLR